MDDPKRWDRKILLLVPEGTYGQDAGPTAAANAVQAFNVQFDPNPQQPLDRRPLRPFAGGARKPVVGRHVTLTFDVDLTGPGTANIGASIAAPAWGPAARMAGLAETVDTTTGSEKVTYEPVSSGYESASIYFHMDGALHKLLGTRASPQLVYRAQDVPVLRLQAQGLHVPVTQAALPGDADWSAWQDGLPATPAHTPTATLHGQAVETSELSINLNQRVQLQQYMNAERIEIGGRQEVSGDILIQAPDLGTKDYFAAAEAETLDALQLVHGTQVGLTAQIDAGQVQLVNPRYEQIGNDIVGLRLDLNLVPTDAGDDELKITLPGA